MIVSRFLGSTIGKMAVFYVDLLCGLVGKAFDFDEGDDE